MKCVGMTVLIIVFHFVILFVLRHVVQAVQLLAQIPVEELVAVDVEVVVRALVIIVVLVRKD